MIKNFYPSVGNMLLLSVVCRHDLDVDPAGQWVHFAGHTRPVTGRDNARAVACRLGPITGSASLARIRGWLLYGDRVFERGATCYDVGGGRVLLGYRSVPGHLEDRARLRYNAAVDRINATLRGGEKLQRVRILEEYPPVVTRSVSALEAWSNPAPPAWCATVKNP